MLGNQILNNVNKVKKSSIDCDNFKTMLKGKTYYAILQAISYCIKQKLRQENKNIAFHISCGIVVIMGISFKFRSFMA